MLFETMLHEEIIEAVKLGFEQNITSLMIILKDGTTICGKPSMHENLYNDKGIIF